MQLDVNVNAGLQTGSRSVGAPKNRMCHIDCLGSSCDCGRLPRRTLCICVRDTESAFEACAFDNRIPGLHLLSCDRKVGLLVTG